MPAGKIFVFAFKPVFLEKFNGWIDGIEKLPFVKAASIGMSLEGRPLRQFTISETEAKRFVAVLGGQHPPEHTANFALTHFVEEICLDSELAKKFRKAFRTVVIPMINPDGKHHGHWRSTLGARDPNRDWYDQSQPEVAATAEFLSDLMKKESLKPYFGVDYHSTNRDFFYIEPADTKTNPEGFTQQWFGMIEKELGGVKVEFDAGLPLASSGSSWMREKLKCPAYTREFRYIQEEKEIATKSRAEARMMMQLLLTQLGENGQ